MKLLFAPLAGLCFLLAVAGAFLPLLPTTPFLLLTSWCLLRSSPRLAVRLHRTRLFGPLLRDWRRHRGVRPHVRLAACGALVAATAIAWFATDVSPLARALHLALAALGVAVILRLPTISR